MSATLSRPQPPPDVLVPETRPRRVRPGSRQAAWLAAGFALAFGVPFLLADTLELNRDLFYGLYALAVLLFVAAWARDGGLGRADLTRNWRWGVGLGAATAGLLALIVLRTDDATERPEGLQFAGAIVWRGVVYGVTDGVLLSVFPILAVFTAFAGTRLRQRRTGTVAVGLLALAASLAITAVYHLGYSDFRSEKVRKPIVGDMVWSAPTLLTLSPLGAPIAHAGLHVAAVVHSYDTDTFLPPHRSSAGYSRPDLQRKLDALVTGPRRIAPGAVAYVSGPRGTWIGSAGIANVAQGREMTTDARMRLESVSKIYTATIVHQLADERKLSLDDTLEQWLPGALPYGDKVRLTQLLTHTSGIPDDNVIIARPDHYLALIGDRKFRSELLRWAKKYRANPALEFSPAIWVRIAAAVPPLFRPGTSYHYSNTGFLLLGRVAEQATGTDIATIYDRRIFRPLGLVRSAWDPQGPIAGPHASGYRLGAEGRLLDTTDWHGGKGADGAVVADAEETGRFLVALMKERFFGPMTLAGMKYGGFWSGGNTLGCGADAYGHAGAGDGFKTEALVSGDGQRVAVLLLNGRGDGTDAVADKTIAELFCSA
jgi:D-alanyl-D-alanine carboxypeptidase